MKPIMPDIADRDACLIWLRNAPDHPDIGPSHFLEVVLLWQARHGGFDAVPDDVKHEVTLATQAMAAQSLMVTAGMSEDEAMDMVTRDAQVTLALTEQGDLAISLEFTDEGDAST